MAHLGDPLEDVGWRVSGAGDGRESGLMTREQSYQMYEEASGLADSVGAS